MSKIAIICVDDEKIILNSLQNEINSILEDNWILEMAESGDEALSLIDELIEEDIQPAVVISDQIMPGMKGDELIINVFQKQPETISVLLTGQADAQAVGNVINNGNLFRYIAKPWEKMDFLMTIKEAIKKYKNNVLVAEQSKVIEDLKSHVVENTQTKEEIELDDRQHLKKLLYQRFLHHLPDGTKEWFIDASLGLINLGGKVTQSSMMFISAIVTENRDKTFVNHFVKRVKKKEVPRLQNLPENKSLTHIILQHLIQILVENKKLTQKEFDYCLHIGGKLGLEKYCVKQLLKFAREEIQLNYEIQKQYINMDEFPQVYETVD